MTRIHPGIIAGDIVDSEFISVNRFDDRNSPCNGAFDAKAAVKNDRKMLLRTVEVPSDLGRRVRFTAELDRCPD